MFPENAIRQVPINKRRNQARQTLPSRDKQTRLFTSPMITKGEGKIGDSGFAFVSGFKVSLVTVAESFDRLMISSVSLHPPWSLLQKTIWDTGVILNHVVRAR